jgi:biotin carboxylase
MTRNAIIVDPYSAATGFGPAFRARGVSPVAVLSTPEPLPAFVSGWHPEEFATVHAHRGSLDDLVITLEADGLTCVIAGIESGVELAEALSEVLTPAAGNVAELASARRDKWQMAMALERAGVPRLRQICTADPAEVQAWIRDNGLEGQPLVLKPPKSGGTDDVHCAAPGEWRPIFDGLLGTVNRFALRTDAVLVQEFADGTEYIVDGYSVDGRYGVVDVCHYRKHSSGSRIGIYDGAEFLPEDAPEVGSLVDYTRQVAAAVGIRNGCSHAEVMLTAEGPRLIEIAARLSGNCMQVCQRLAVGDSQIDRTIRHRLDGEFTPGYTLHQHVLAVWLSARRPGRLVNAEVLNPAGDLPTVQSLELLYRTGDIVPCTLDLFTLLGVAVLASTDKEAIEADYRRIQELQEQLVTQTGDD